MSGPASDYQTASFDLTSLAKANKGYACQLRLFLLFIAIFGGGFALVGVLILLSVLAAGLGAVGRAPGAALVALGLVICGAAWSQARGFGSAPRRLVVDLSLIHISEPTRP